MRAPADVVGAVTRRLGATWHLEVAGEPGAWPHTIPLGRPTGAQLESDFRATLIPDIEALTLFATRHGLELHGEPRRVFGTMQHIPVRVTVPDLDCAAALAGEHWPRTVSRGRDHAATIAAEHPVACDVPGALRELARMSEIDSRLAFAAATWFSRNASAAAGLTPRQVPVEGLQTKWLNGRRALVANLAGLGALGLASAHPARVHVTFLDPKHLAAGGRRYDCFSTGDSAAPPYEVRVVIISENKDTAVAFPALPGGVAIEGEGRGARTIAALPWLADVPTIFYWGDMDQDGLEILNEFRAAGIPAISLMMDMAAYKQYRTWGSDLDPRGTPVQVRAPRPVPHLHEGELELYRLLSDPTIAGPRRIEQERIPLGAAANVVLSEFP
ncbi:MAG: Wadjet anti-phage system protein JetD domain-containing protein [Candidatus Phosphoribacter sp.]